MVVPFDRAFKADDLPAFMERAFPALFIGLGVLAAIGLQVRGSGDHLWVAVLLVLVAISPWVMVLLGVRLVDSAFVAVVVVPIGVVVVLGEAVGVVDLDEGWPQLVHMLLIGLVGQVAVMGSNRLVWCTTLVAIGIIVAGALVRGDPLDYTGWFVGLMLAVSGGRAFRGNIIHVAELRRTHQELARQQLADERRRIAREVHDIVAHTMSVTMLHLTAARLAVRTDAAAAEEALAEAERNGRASMEEIRGVVRLLRTDEDAVVPALPDADDIRALVDRYVAAGSDVRFHLDGALGDLPGAHRLAAYRVLQESLTNAVRHGCDPVEVRLTCTGDAVELDVANGMRREATATSSGTGMTGMRERIEALDGTFSAGPDGCGWLVRARIPA